MTRSSGTLEPPPARRWRVLRHGLRALLGLGVGLAIAEGAFWMRDAGAFPHLNVYIPDPALGVRLKPGASERIRFSNNPVTSIRINAEGYRGGPWPPPSERGDEVVVVGDSQVFGLGVEENETFSMALSSALGGKYVRNLGVPTYGPHEYNAVLAESLAKRPAKTVVYVVNLANDLFEASRPNRDRHAVWDGWAVRKETAPEATTTFPGRQFIYAQSHAVYALRRVLHERGPKIDERGFASEGTWRDISGAASSAQREHATLEQESIRLAQVRESELAHARTSIAAVQAAVDDKVIDANRDKFVDRNPQYQNRNYLEPDEIYRAAALNPGDIVSISNGESGRDVRVTAEQIRRGAALRSAMEQEFRKRAESKRESDKEAKEALALLERRDSLTKRERSLATAAPPKAVPLSPLTPAIREAKTICDKFGARLLVVALPIDIQVSPSEWAKYGAEPVDMEATKVLLDDVVAAAIHVGAEGIDATPALAAAEPGAFLDGDIHMTPKGHRALGDAIAGVLRSPPRKLPSDGLPAGRSWPPKPEEWTPYTEIVVRESDPAGCETKRVREWLGVFCRNPPNAKSVTVTQGTEVVAGAVPGQAMLIAPLVAGQEIRATFVYDDAVRELAVTGAEVPERASVAFSKPTPATSAAPTPAPPPQAVDDAFCKCVLAAGTAKKCSDARSLPDADCARTFPNDCAKLLACAAGDPVFAPRCAPGFANAGAQRRCVALCSREKGDKSCAKGRCVDWQGAEVCL